MAAIPAKSEVLVPPSEVEAAVRAAAENAITERATDLRIAIMKKKESRLTFGGPSFNFTTTCGFTLIKSEINLFPRGGKYEETVVSVGRCGVHSDGFRLRTAAEEAEGGSADGGSAEN